jgi:hypothetical protein
LFFRGKPHARVSGESDVFVMQDGKIRRLTTCLAELKPKPSSGPSLTSGP